jgi:predicted aspartyl protease
MFSLLTACQPAEHASLTFEECEDLRVVVEARQKYGIIVASQQEDIRALQRCLSFPYMQVLAGVAPKIYSYGRYEPSPPVPSSGPVEPETANEVRLVLHQGVFTVPVVINRSIIIPFVLDSGAADVQLPAEVVLTLVRTGTVSEADFLGEGSYVHASGATFRSPRFNIREMRVGNHVVTNVAASVGPAIKSDALLGQSFLSKLRSWTLDNDRHVLILQN